MHFDSHQYGQLCADILGFGSGGHRPIPLVAKECTSVEASELLRTLNAKRVLAGARSAEAAWSGLWFYYSCFQEAHEIAQELETKEGEYWHALVHRVEPDAANASYWFRRLGSHPVFSLLVERAAEILERHGVQAPRLINRWDPYAFLDFCDRARQHPGSPAEAAALEIQLTEWQLLFDYCARPAA